MSLWFFEMVSTHERSLQRKFIAPRCSCAYIFCVATVLAAIILPFIAAFATGSFWLKLQIYHEQPLVSFAHDYLLVLDGTTDAANSM